MFETNVPFRCISINCNSTGSRGKKLGALSGPPHPLLPHESDSGGKSFRGRPSGRARVRQTVGIRCPSASAPLQPQRAARSSSAPSIGTSSPPKGGRIELSRPTVVSPKPPISRPKSSSMSKLGSSLLGVCARLPISMLLSVSSAGAGVDRTACSPGSSPRSSPRSSSSKNVLCSCLLLLGLFLALSALAPSAIHPGLEEARRGPRRSTFCPGLKAILILTSASEQSSRRYLAFLE
ncbi:hypothetical protein KC330_g154 [Hortaea werneckii]|nr:hypothetical protein KC330_g154 [Hortaea werneckii]